MPNKGKTKLSTRSFYESLLTDGSGTINEYRNAVKFFRHHKEEFNAVKIQNRMKSLYKITKKGGNKVNVLESCANCKHTVKDNRPYAMTKSVCNNSKSVKFEMNVSHKETCSKREER